MKYVLAAVILFLYISPVYSQQKQRFLTAFFVNQFNGDSINVLLDGKNIYSARLKTDPLLGQSDGQFVVLLSNSVQKLVIIEAPDGKQVQTIVQGKYEYLYIFKDAGKYRFDYSQKLWLPE
jgi:hypothetical protein